MLHFKQFYQKSIPMDKRCSCIKFVVRSSFFYLHLRLSTRTNQKAVHLILISILQEAIVKIMKMRKKISNAQLQTELVEILKNMFLPSKKMIKEQIEWLIEHKYMKRDDDNINMFIYMA